MLVSSLFFQTLWITAEWVGVTVLSALQHQQNFNNYFLWTDSSKSNSPWCQGDILTSIQGGEEKALRYMQCFLLVLHVCCITHTRFQGNINIRSSRWIAIPHENMSPCSIIAIDVVLIFSSIKVCFPLSHWHFSGLFPLLFLPSANLFFPPSDGFTVSFLLPCVKIVKEEVRPALPFIR